MHNVSLRRLQPHLGTYVELELSAEKKSSYNRADLLAISRKIYAEIARLEAIFSFHFNQSELSKINRLLPKETLEVSQDMAELLQFSLRVSRLTNGAFDPCIGNELQRREILPRKSLQQTGDWQDLHLNGNLVSIKRPLRLDFGGLAKGWIVDKAAEILFAHPNIHFCINAGGDLLAKPYINRRVNIAHAKGTHAITMPLPALATSSAMYTTEEKFPIIDPRHPQKALNATNSVSVFAPSCAVADMATKLCFIEKSDSVLQNWLHSFQCIALFLSTENPPKILGTPTNIHL